MEKIKRQVTTAEKKMRGKILAILIQMGYTLPDGAPDYPRINGFIQNIGNRNPRKVILNYLYKDELALVLVQVQEYQKHELERKANHLTGFPNPSDVTLSDVQKKDL